MVHSTNWLMLVLPRHRCKWTWYRNTWESKASDACPWSCVLIIETSEMNNGVVSVLLKKKEEIKLTCSEWILDGKSGRLPWGSWLLRSKNRLRLLICIHHTLAVAAFAVSLLLSVHDNLYSLSKQHKIICFLTLQKRLQTNKLYQITQCTSHTWVGIYPC